ncbi:MAG: beta-N-acetylhexosaminidase [Rhodospirillales bacterium]|nr:beta-N-acetylhexosaminidase [Rhodospirillales bacterium]
MATPGGGSAWADSRRSRPPAPSASRFGPRAASARLSGPNGTRTIAPPPPRAAIVGIAATALTDDERRLFAALPPAGVILFARNIADPAQLTRLIAQIRAAVPGVLLMVDQEGGRVARLRPPHWPARPPASMLATEQAARAGGEAIGHDAAAAGFDVVAAPVLDRALPGASTVVGDRAFPGDARDVARLGRAFAAGLMAAGVIPVGKHVPGHGRARVDSHESLPVVDGVDPDDLLPFAANADLPWMMTAHVLFTAWDRTRPATLSPVILREVVRGRIGFGGVLVSDDLAMGALSGAPADLALACLEAGCDLALWCPGDAATADVLRAVPPLTPEDAARIGRGGGTGR